MVPPSKYDWICVSFCPPKSTTQMANWSVQSFLRSSQQKVSVLYNWRPFSAILPLPIGASGRPYNTWFLGPIKAHNQNGISIGSAVFAHDCRVSLVYSETSLSCLRIAPTHGGDLDRHLIRCSLSQPVSSTRTASLSIQPFLQGSVVWQTDIPVPCYSVGNNRLHLRT